MEKQDKIKITSRLHKEISTQAVINGKKYLVLTEEINPQKHLITTKVYLGGKIISTRDTECKHILNAPDAEKRLAELIHSQHKTIIEMLKIDYEKKVKRPSDYLDETKTLLQKKNNKAALELLTFALEQYPDEPFLLSYYGCLEAILNKEYAYGIETCLKALRICTEEMPFGQEIFYPTFYLNLGRAYLAAKNKKEAVRAFQKGLTYDRENRDLLWELKKLGARKKPIVTYLERSNPINKYIGMILHKLGRSSS